MKDGVKIDVDFTYIAFVAMVIWFWQFDGVSLGRAVVFALTDGAVAVNFEDQP